MSFALGKRVFWDKPLGIIWNLGLRMNKNVVTIGTTHVPEK